MRRLGTVPPTSTAILAEASAGAADGWIAVGSHNLQVNADHGAVVAVAAHAPRLRACALVVVDDLGSEGGVVAEPRACPPGERDARPLDDPERRVLQVLELLAPAAVHVNDLAAIAGVSDAAEVLDRLSQAGAARAHGPRWSATLAAGSEPISAHDADLLLQRARDRLATGIDARPSEDVPAILAALHAGGAAQRWHDVLALARAADPLLMLSGRWGAWDCALERARMAALVTGDRAASAWALHQLGTRAGYLGDVEAAVPELEEALALRRELGDEAGAAVTAGNLAVLRMQEFPPCPSSS